MLITAGIVVLADVVTTLLWREPVSSLYASVRQGDASSALAKLEGKYRGAADRTHARGTVRGVAVLARRFGRQVTDGQAIGRLVIPTIGLNIVFVQGTDAADLEQGPGHYPSTPLPGQPGTTAIAGHRTTYLAPFRDLGSLGRGDSVEIEMPYGTLEYRVRRTKVVQPTDLGVLRRVSSQRLVLTACHPLYSAAERIVAFARLARVRSIQVPAGGHLG
jgi:sortase A